MKNKKGNVETILFGVLALIIAGFLLIMGLILLDELYLDTADHSTLIHNETLTAFDETGETVTNSGACGFHDFNVLNYYNESGAGPEILSANFTTNPRTGLVQFTGTDVNYNKTANINVTYSYRYGDTPACEKSNITIGGIGKFADYIDLIVLAIIITAIISLLLVIISTRRVK